MEYKCSNIIHLKVTFRILKKNVIHKNSKYKLTLFLMCDKNDSNQFGK